MSMPVAEAISDLRAELSEAEKGGDGALIRFEISEVELELQLVLSNEVVGKAKVGWGVLSVGADGKTSDERTHRLKLTMKVVGQGGGSVPIASHSRERPNLPAAATHRVP